MPSSSLGRLRSWIAVSSVAVLGCVSTAGCADAGERADRSSDAVTDVPQTAVQAQTANNCWIYSTTAWIESLELATVGEPRVLSEDWLTYWASYETILYDSVDAVDTGGWYEVGAHLVERYGVADASFKAANVKAALARVKAAAKAGGPLASRASQHDGAKVRAVLDDAFELPSATRAAMDDVFGTDGARPVDASAERSASRRAIGVRAPAEVSVYLPNPETHARERRTLADAVGDDGGMPLRELANRNVARKGPYAWRTVKAPAIFGDYRDWVRRVQRALNDGYAVPADWFVDDARTTDGTHYFEAPQRTDGPHASLITDYQAEDVPGFGELKLGVPERRPEALAAALADGTRVTFIRLKNSYGPVGVAGGATSSIPGYVDLAYSYFSAKPNVFQRGIFDAYLPAGY